MDVTALFHEHHAPLFRYLSRLTGDADVAADAAQEAFVRLYTRPPREPGNVRAWLYKVATNSALEGRRTAARRGRILAGAPSRAAIGDAPAAPDAALDTAERRKIVHAALQALPERDRMLLLMREEGFSHREMAEAAGTTTGSVGTLLARALDRLARELKLDEERPA